MTNVHIKEFVKNNTWMYKTYYYCMSFFLRLIKLFIKTDDKLILFVSYGGRYCNDSPKTLYDAMKRDERFCDYKMVWAFMRPEDFPDLDTVKIDTMRYFIIALKARCWITNVAVERGLNFKGKRTYYFHTTHTTLPKLMKYDDKSGTFTLPCGFKYDCSCAQSQKEKELQKTMFGLNDEQIIVSGYPKLDALCHYSTKQRNDFRGKLRIGNNKIAILYAPTYRDVKFGAMRCPINFDHWQEILGDEFVVLFRAHPVVANETKIDPNRSFVYDVSSYPDNMELMIASDILISDYSGIFFEYAVQNKPMFCFAYDYEEYIKTRQLYFDIRKELPGGLMTEAELLESISRKDYKPFESMLDSFRKRYVSEYGHSTELCLNNIIQHIS